ncbi:hypothetical protein, partial [Vibrio parahaemolyticus]|uniref:hypothetical protein n=1 Tax=Vibrio parahaemolyticus TaxID=670 RepID=UPI001C60E14F
SRAFVVLGAVIFPSKSFPFQKKSYQSGKLTGQVYPSSRRHFGDSFGAIQKTIPCITDFGDDVVVIRKRLVASTNSRLVR